MKKISATKFQVPNLTAEIASTSTQEVNALMQIEHDSLIKAPMLSSSLVNDALNTSLNLSEPNLTESTQVHIISEQVLHPANHRQQQQQQQQQYLSLPGEQQQPQYVCLSDEAQQQNQNYQQNDSNLYYDLNACHQPQTHVTLEQIVSSCMRPIMQEFSSMVIDKFSAVEQAVTALTTRVVGIEKSLQKVIPEVQTKLSDDDMAEISSVMPAKTVDELRQLDDRLKDARFFEMVLAKFPPEKVNGRTKALNIFDEFISRYLATQISFSGISHTASTPAKPSILDFDNVAETMKKIVVACDPTYNESQHCKFLQCMLQNANTRYKRFLEGPLKRRSTSKTMVHRKRKKNNKDTSGSPTDNGTDNVDESFERNQDPDPADENEKGNK